MRPSRLALASGAAALALGVGACTHSPSSLQGGGPPASEARIGLVEWGFTSTASALVAGPVRLEVTNAGSTAHDLQLLVEDEVVAATRALRPGESQTLHADLSDVEQASLMLCTLPGHKAKGMVTEIDVVASSASQTEGGSR